MKPILPWSAVSVVVLGLLSTAASPSVVEDFTRSVSALDSTARVGDKFGDKLTMQVDRSKIDLRGRRLEVQMNRPVSRIEIKVFDEHKATLAEETLRPEDTAVGVPIEVRWSQRDDTQPARIELYGYDTEDNWVGVAIIPWNVKIPHEEVHFATDKANLEKSEVPKLQDSLLRINEAIDRFRELGKIQLFIAGHTDTVGAPTYNLDLSRRRAQAIAGWFVKNGLTIPVAFEGFGESALLVETKDEVDEPRNRRVDYILSVEPPAGKSGRMPAWRYLNRTK